MARGQSSYVDCEILKLVLQYSDHLGYSTSHNQLATFFREAKQSISDREIIDSLRRLRPIYLTVWKWSEGNTGSSSTNVKSAIASFSVTFNCDGRQTHSPRSRS